MSFEGRSGVVRESFGGRSGIMWESFGGRLGVVWGRWGRLGFGFLFSSFGFASGLPDFLFSSFGLAPRLGQPQIS